MGTEPHIWIWVWLALAGILAVAEFLTGGFYQLPFAIGAAVAAGLEYFIPGSINAQWIAFIGVSSVLLVILRRWVLRTEARAATAESDEFQS